MRLPSTQTEHAPLTIVGCCHGFSAIPEGQLSDYYAGYRYVGRLAILVAIAMLFLSFVIEGSLP